MNTSVVNKLKKYSELNVMLISDEFTANNIKDEFNIFTPTPENFREILDNNDIDLFFCESAWNGVDSSWNMKVTFHENQILKLLVKECKKRNITTIFWNKEDPAHFQHFIDSAKVFDYVYTTDIGLTEKYKSFGCENVDYSPFFINAKMFNPINEMNRENKVVYAGAYYSTRFNERADFMEIMLEVFGKYGLTIYDRNFNNPDTPHKFPDKYKDFIVGSLKADEIMKAYKGYKVCVNTNSILDSDTMFARRVIESLACNTPVVSSYAKSINKLFNGIVIASSEKKMLEEEVERLFNDAQFYQHKQIVGVREVFKNYTTKSVLPKLLKKSKIDFEYHDKKTINVISVCENKEQLDKILENFHSQTLENKMLYIFSFKDLEILDSNNHDVCLNIINKLEDILNYKDIFKFEYITIFNPKAIYGIYYLEDMMNSYYYVDNKTIVTRNFGSEYTYVNEINKDYCIVPKNKFEDIFINGGVKESNANYKIFNSNNDLEYIIFENKFFKCDNPNFNLTLKEDGKLHIIGENNTNCTERIYYSLADENDSLKDVSFDLKPNKKYKINFEYEKLSEKCDVRITIFLYNKEKKIYTTTLLSENINEEIINVNMETTFKMFISARDNIEILINKLSFQELV